MSLFKASITIGGWTMISRLLGFARDMAFAVVAGAGMIADAYFVAFRFPNMFRALFAEGAMNAAFVPLFSQELENGGTDKARVFAQSISFILTIWIVFFVSVMWYFMDTIMVVQARGYVGLPDKFSLTVSLAQIMFPYIGFMILNALFAGILNSFEKFALPAATPCLLNITALCVLGLVGFDVIPLTGYELAIGVVIAGFLQATVLCFGCIINGIMPFGFGFQWTAAVKSFFKRVLPVVFGASVLQLNIFIGTIFATTLSAGSVSFLYYADRLVQLPLGVVGIAIGVAVLPMLTKSITKNAYAEARTHQSNAIFLSILLTIPATVALYVLAMPIISTLFMHGAFDLDAMYKTADALQAYAVGLPAFVLIKILSPAFFARGDTKTPVQIAVFCMVLYIGNAYVLMGYFQHVGLAIATSISAWVNVLILYGVMRLRKYEAFEKGIAIKVIKVCMCAVTMGFALQGVVIYFGDVFMQHSLQRLGMLAGIIIFGVATLIIMIFVTKTTTTAQVKGFLRRK